MATKITRDVLESYLHCKFKGHLKQTGQHETKCDYENLLTERRAEVRLAAIDKILARHAGEEIPRNIALTTSALKQGASFILDPTLEDDFFSLAFDGLKKVEGPSKLGDCHYIPILFHEGEKVRKVQRLLLEICGLLLSRLQGCSPAIGIVWHGKESEPTRVRLNADLRKTERLLRDLKDMNGAESPPKLILNDHCQICEFRQQCHAQAVQEDNLSLLRAMGEKEVKQYARKGIFTLTQLSHTFRPRRKGKRVTRKSSHRYHALQALAIRDKKIYVFGTPKPPESPVRVYLDFEGNPDEGFVYLIGMVVIEGTSERRCSFWADSPEQEGRICEQFLAEVERYEDLQVFCYGGYERAFLKRMRKVVKRKNLVDRVLGALVNTLSVIYSHVYFPVCSNGLKDTGGYLGCSWTEPDASGIQSIVWRKRWESSHEEKWKQKLTVYNLDDCAALRKVTEVVYAVSARARSAAEPKPGGATNPPAAWVEDLDKLASDRKWGSVHFFHPDWDYINKCAYFDYQRERVYVRTSKRLKRICGNKKGKHNRKMRVTKHITIPGSTCPFCRSGEIAVATAGGRVTCRVPRVKRALNLVLTSGGIKREVIESRASLYQCLKCSRGFVPEPHRCLDRHFHSLKSWAMYQHVAHRLSIRTIRVMFEEFFGLRIHRSDIHLFKSQMARYYKATCDQLLQNLLSGYLLHIDETEITLQTGKVYVWVFTNLEEVVFLYKPNREGEFLRDLLKDFRGVLVSDFYAAYDSIPCQQQKCLIHLIRDMNQELLNNPFDEELQSVTRPFGVLLRAIVSTIDEHGLKRTHLKKHAGAVARYFRLLSEQDLRSDAAEAMRKRLTKYQDKLFTFIDYDGVPWNNNNAENAIKRFAYYREVVTGIMKERGLSDYLMLLSLYQTCRYKGVSFLKFLVSGERDIDLYSEKKRLKQRPEQSESHS